ncbi:MAG TPA: Rrf2 family transcriptional regulator [Gemmatimonadales bacterium]|nr:Rrf2 family transcriptional regulator [Gemmatimonadales bacterium]
MLSHTAEYALRTVLFIAERGDSEPVSVDEIAAALRIPRNYLSKTLHRLAHEGVLLSSRGKGGGFRLAVPPERLRLLQVVELFDRIGAGRQCLLGRPVCSDQRACEAHARWKDVAGQLAAFFHETTVADLLGESRRPIAVRG